jgi:predicted amidohydrolase
VTDLKISTVQFEHRSADKSYNLDQIEKFAALASQANCDVVAFHECSVTGYTFARDLSTRELLDISELIPEGTSVTRLQEIASRHKINILAGLFEKDRSDNIFKAYVCVGKNGFIAKHRKLHPFINKAILPGSTYTVFEISGWKCGILICYDNNIIENVRATKLEGADIIFMPHVTMCTPSPRPGSGFIDPGLWKEKELNKEILREEFDGPKGREWLMRWLPSRACDNGIYVVFSNAIGMDHDQLKNGCSMIIDPYGEVIAECRSVGDEMVSAVLSYDKVEKAGGTRYTNARKPELYRDIIGRDHDPVQKIAWLNDDPEK